MIKKFLILYFLVNTVFAQGMPVNILHKNNINSYDFCNNEYDCIYTNYEEPKKLNILNVSLIVLFIIGSILTVLFLVFIFYKISSYYVINYLRLK